MLHSAQAIRWADDGFALVITSMHDYSRSPGEVSRKKWERAGYLMDGILMLGILMDGILTFGFLTFGFAITILRRNVSEFVGTPGKEWPPLSPAPSPFAVSPRQQSNALHPPTRGGRGTLAQVPVEQHNGGNGPPF